jgi:flavin-binding protein dodecin
MFMTVIKSIELVGSSPEGFEKAVSNAVDEAKKTIRNLRRIEVDGMEVLVENDQIVSYQAKIKLFFLVER